MILEGQYTLDKICKVGGESSQPLQLVINGICHVSRSVYCLKAFLNVFNKNLEREKYMCSGTMISAVL